MDNLNVTILLLIVLIVVLNKNNRPRLPTVGDYFNLPLGLTDWQHLFYIHYTKNNPVRQCIRQGNGLHFFIVQLFHFYGIMHT